MDFFNGKQGIPLSFFWMMAKDKEWRSLDGISQWLISLYEK
jgi:hypothetical protein